MTLPELHTRIKGSRLWGSGRHERLYVQVGRPKERNAITCYFFNRGNGKIGLTVAYDPEKSVLKPEYLKQISVETEKELSALLNDDKPVPPFDVLAEHIDEIQIRNELLATLTSMQVDAVRFLCDRSVGALHAPIGTGKTRITAVVAQARYEAGQIDQAMVFCPVGLKRQFAAEWAKVATVPLLVYGLESMSQSSRIAIDALERCNDRTMVIVDESHMVKTPKAKRTIRMHKLVTKVRYVCVVTGTPITDAVQNVWAQYHLLSPKIIGVDSWDTFAKKYLVYGGPTGTEVIAYKRLSHLVAKLTPYTFASHEGEWRYSNERHFVLPHGDALESYSTVRDEFLATLQDDDKPPHPTVIFGYLLRLHLAALSVRNRRYAKIEEIAGDDQSVIFTPYVADAYAIRDYFGADRCVMVTGRELAQRSENVGLFRAGERQFCICTMASGSTGLDGLQVASKLFFAAHSWKWSERKQSIGRIARMGQANEAKIYDVTVGLGICVKILGNLDRKTGLVEEVRGMMNRVEDLRRFAATL